MLKSLSMPCLLIALAGCEAQEVRPIPVAQLSKDYEDIARGDERYRGKDILIRGRMRGTGLTDAVMAAEWGIPENVYYLCLAEADTTLVVCLFANDPAVGGWATVRGRCRGAKVAGRPTLEDCTVVR